MEYLNFVTWVLPRIRVSLRIDTSAGGSDQIGADEKYE